MYVLAESAGYIYQVVLCANCCMCINDLWLQIYVKKMTRIYDETYIFRLYGYKNKQMLKII